MAGTVERRLVELRVHGVSGTPPEATLGTQGVIQVAGDDLSRVFRKADAESRPGLGHLIEAFHWGRHTAGAWRQGLWFLLAPFGMINVAQFMLPTPVTAAAKACHAMVGAGLRGLGLVLTLLFTTSIAVVLLDLVAWQWILEGGTATPAAEPSTWRDRVVGLGPATLIVIALLLVVVLVVLLSRLGRRPGTEGEAPSGTRTQATELGRARFYAGDPDAPALSSLHLGAALVLLGYFGLSVVEDRMGDWEQARAFAGWALVAIAIVVLLMGDPEQSARIAKDDISPLRKAATGVLGYVGLLAGIAALAVAVVALATSGEGLYTAASGDSETPRPLPVSEEVARWLLGAGLLALAVVIVSNTCLALATRLGRSTGDVIPRPFRPFLGGQTAAVVATIGTFLAAGLSALVTYGTQTVVNLLADGDESGSVAFAVPRVLQRIVYAWGVTVILIATVGIAVGVYMGCRHKGFRRAVLREFGRVSTTVEDPVPAGSWVRRIAFAMGTARLKNLLPVLLPVFAIAGLVLYVAMAVEEMADRPGSCLSGISPFDWLSGHADPDCGGAPWVSWLGTAFLAALATRLYFLGRSAVTSPEKRRQPNVVWDVIAFWPRSVHPFTPWPYSQRVVADLVQRLRHHLQQHDQPHVVLAAHSQGSVIAVAATLWMTDDELQRMSLLTFGSQLRMQFARAFPACLDYAVLHSVWLGIDRRWASLYRDTDPIGGPALSWSHQWKQNEEPMSCDFTSPLTPVPDHVSSQDGLRCCGPEWRLLDPPAPHGRSLQNGAFAQLSKHSDYYNDARYDEAVRSVVTGDAFMRSVTDEQSDGQAAEQSVDSDTSDVRDDPRAGEEVAPGAVG